jgi:pyridoxal 5'-phosphate synthase pdxT subunit
MRQVGILALQGSIIEHEKMLNSLNEEYIKVRTKSDLELVSHLIIPGGESTTLQILLEQKDMWELFQSRVNNEKLKVFGTCAGAILCSRAGARFQLDRNGFGAQQNSFIASLVSEKFSKLEGIFIRAPRFKKIDSSVDILATLENEPVLLKDRNFLIASFHPELSGEKRIYEYFLDHI